MSSLIARSAFSGKTAGQLNNVSLELAEQVVQNVDGPISSEPAPANAGYCSAKLSQPAFAPRESTTLSRPFAILVDDGFDRAQVDGIRAALNAGMAHHGPYRHDEGWWSTLFDALVFLRGAAH
ncbi:uncharacterized protein BXZ73DRAFT_105697 [Epithele typhae]|uniref:uncharacterized protein n=1 Tax=Epithele typhae TaxID=378194 RepID=UPI002007B8D2|nr:uncharacterized protein BXZ73DRAFT_105697 [Epithele typhae]KAH9916717.1 hypothetical protein BXZ73DRAFT_105697 [Epithele typhae]